MVLAGHLVFTAYGFWLPNDPRGSWSDFVRSIPLRQYGPPTKTTVRHSVAAVVHDVAQRRAAKTALTFPPVQFTGEQAREVARGIRDAVAESNYHVLACAILPDHVHVVVRTHANPFPRIVGHFKQRATERLLASRLHPMQHQIQTSDQRISCWTSRGWKVFLYDRESIEHAIQYVNMNPVRCGLKRQTWSFVQPLNH